MNTVNRYNQGFGGFGLMEQCSDGKYVLAEDYNKLMADREVLINYISTLDEDVNYLDRKSSRYYEHMVHYFHRVAILRLLVLAMMTIAAITIAH